MNEMTKVLLKQCKEHGTHLSHWAVPRLWGDMAVGYNGACLFAVHRDLVKAPKVMRDERVASDVDAALAKVRAAQTVRTTVEALRRGCDAAPPSTKAPTLRPCWVHVDGVGGRHRRTQVYDASLIAGTVERAAKAGGDTEIGVGYITHGARIYTYDALVVHGGMWMASFAPVDNRVHGDCEAKLYIRRAA